MQAVANSAIFRREAEHAERLANTVGSEDVRDELLEIASEYWKKSKAWQCAEHKRSSMRRLHDALGHLHTTLNKR